VAGFQFSRFRGCEKLIFLAELYPLSRKMNDQSSFSGSAQQAFANLQDRTTHGGNKIMMGGGWQTIAQITFPSFDEYDVVELSGELFEIAKEPQPPY
jgi:dihydrofolate reductase